MELTEAQLLPFATELNPLHPPLDALPTAAPSGLPSVGVGTGIELLPLPAPIAEMESHVKEQESSPAPASPLSDPDSLTGIAAADVPGVADRANSSVTAGTFGAANVDPLTGTPVRQPAANQIVVIDPSVGDWQNLAAGVTPGAEVFVLDATKDGVEQIAQLLAGRPGISSLHIVSHGSPGSVLLGNTWLSGDTINNYATQLQSWAGALFPKNNSAGADIVVYGCEVGAGVAGEALTRRLAQLTGADVAASDDPTGSAAKGGDWVLEYATGTIEAPRAFQMGVMEAYDWVLLPAELFISEYVEGSGNNKALEFYNGTGAAIDLGAGGYAVDIYSNGSSTVSFTHNLTGTVANSDVYVFALNNNTNAAILAQADQTNTDQFSWYNGDDAVVLRKGATVIDVIGQVGFDPGTQWGAGATSTQDNTIRRNPSVTAGDTNPSDAFAPSQEWIGFANNTYNGLGSHNSAPAITLSAAGLNYAENDGAVLIDGAATLTDSDSPNFNTGNLTASITAGGTADDRLAIRNQGTAAGEIGVSGSDVTYGGVTIGSFTGGTGTAPLAITFNASATPAAAEALLKNITYENISETLSTGSRTVQFQVTDQLGGVSNTATKTVSVTAVNDAPVLDNSGSPTLATINQNEVSNQGTPISDIIGSSITDADTGAVQGIAVTGLDTSNGTWEYSTDGGSTWTAFGTVSDSSATVLTAASTNRIRFLPSNNFNGTASITYRAWDTADGSASGTAGADASTNGGATAFSSASETAGITVIPPTVSITATDSSAAEPSDTGTYRITRTSSAGNLTVKLAIAGTSATADYSLSASNGGAINIISAGEIEVTIPDGQTYIDVTVTPVDDIAAEADETLQLTLTNDAAYAIDAAQDTAAVTIVANDTAVTNTNDAGEGSLRQAILNANAFAGADTVSFDTAGVFATAQTITLTSGGLQINGDVTISGTGAANLTVSGNNTYPVFDIFGAGADVTVDALTIAGGRGGIFIGSGSTVTVTNSTLSGNVAEFGGGINNYGGSVTVTNSTFSGNEAAAGGGILNIEGSVTVTNSTFSGNTASAGGGINNYDGTVTVTNSTFSGNKAFGGGGGIFHNGGTVTVTNSTITNNTADSDGDGTGDGGGAYTVSGGFTLRNTIIAGNSDSSATTKHPDISGNITGNSNNLIGDITGSTGTAGTGSDKTFTSLGITDISQVLGPLASNGGATQTHALVDGSPAIDGGNNASIPPDTLDSDGDGDTAEPLPYDQRGTGFSRILGAAVDIGAVEHLPPTASITATDNSAAEPSDTGTYRITRTSSAGP